MDFRHKQEDAMKRGDERASAFWGFLQRHQEQPEIFDAMLGYLTEAQGQVMRILLTEIPDGDKTAARICGIPESTVRARQEDAIERMMLIFNLKRQHAASLENEQGADESGSRQSAIPNASDNLKHQTIDVLGLQPQVLKTLIDKKIFTLHSLTQALAADLVGWRIGEGNLRNIRSKLRERGLHLRGETLDGLIDTSPQTPLKALLIDVWALRRLEEVGIVTIGDIGQVYAVDLLRIPKFYESRLQKLRKDLAGFGIYFRGEEPEQPSA